MNDLTQIEARFGDLAPCRSGPDWWLAKPDQPQTLALLDQLKQARIHEIGRSAGDRPIIAIEYGAFEPLDATSDNLPSSIASKLVPPDPTEIFPPAFFGKQRRRQPVLALQGGIHGGELTGTVASLNLCHIIEHGTDLRGQAWPRLAELARQTRLVIIPWLNPDGTARWPLLNPYPASTQLTGALTHGMKKNGELCSYMGSKEFFPMPVEEMSFLGTYFNDAGVNLQYDFVSVERQPETKTWMRYYLKERPDGVLIFHCNGGSMMGPPESYIPEGYQIEATRLAGALDSRLKREGLPLGRMSWRALPGLGKPYLEQMAATYQVCGALPLMVELPCGCAAYGRTLEQALDISLITIEETLFYAHTDGLRPFEVWSKVKRQLERSAQA